MLFWRLPGEKNTYFNRAIGTDLKLKKNKLKKKEFAEQLKRGVHF